MRALLYEPQWPSLLVSGACYLLLVVAHEHWDVTFRAKSVDLTVGQLASGPWAPGERQQKVAFAMKAESSGSCQWDSVVPLPGPVSLPQDVRGADFFLQGHQGGCVFDKQLGDVKLALSSSSSLPLSLCLFLSHSDRCCLL